MLPRTGKLILVTALLCAAWPLRAAAQCSKDTDCKGERICVKGECVSPGAASTPVPQPPPTVAPPPAVAPPLPVVPPPATVTHPPRRELLAAHGGPLIDRPLLLPRFIFQPWVEFGITNSSIYEDAELDTTKKVGTGCTVSFGVDIGLPGRFQLGALFALPVSPSADIGTFVFDLQYGLLKQLNLRLDLGAQHQLVHALLAGALYSQTLDGFVMGVGAPLKIKLHRMLALTSGSTMARGFETPPVITAGQAVSFGSIVASQDIFSLGVWNQSGDNVVGGVINLPVGLLFQPHPMLALQARTGYRLSFTKQSGGSSTTHMVPVALDVVVTVARRIDLGFTASLTGTVHGTTASGDPTTFSYLDIRKFDLWVAARF